MKKKWAEIDFTDRRRLLRWLYEEASQRDKENSSDGPLIRAMAHEVESVVANTNALDQLLVAIDSFKYGLEALQSPELKMAHDAISEIQSTMTRLGDNALTEEDPLTEEEDK